MEKFNLPLQFKKVLDLDSALSGLVNTSLGEFSPWLKRNNVKFFTEYTDHSLEHVEDVLKEAGNLIREPSRKIITSADAAVLVLATLLHDCAMHLSVDGFNELIQSDERPIIPGFDDKPWKILWLDFFAEARKFSGRRLMTLFGNIEPVQYPPVDSQQMTGRDLLLIGEFLRRHHHRLAHEIAHFGVPGPTNEKLKFITTDDTKYIIDLAGVVARSHGMNIRNCVDYLKTNYSSEKIYKGVHTIFVMILLRIADILQIESKRAPQQIEKVQKLQSPVSSGEWEMHQAIKDINKNHENPETIFVMAQPTNARTYLRIRRMLDQIQNELDASWTVIGETYGFIPQFQKIGLKYRWIKSNIDDLNTFSKQVKYIPTQASFEVADSDLLKLLIGPLYGYRPEIGVRELLQNSLDAVREIREYQRQYPEFNNVELTQQDGDVVISIDQYDGKWWITVSDKGIGMTLETVKDYYLKAGASLRRSEIWRKTFENKRGKSKVLRSGRFGIGALAAFLLGQEIYLSTRYIKSTSNDGIEFSTQVDAEFIELKHVERPVGTTIRIGLTEKIKDILIKAVKHGTKEEDEDYTRGDDWDWYYLDDPKVTRYISGEILQTRYKLPTASPDLPIGWNRISYPGYDDIQWTYLHGSKENKFRNNNSVVCNGIPIEDRFSKEYILVNGIDFFNGTFGFRAPNISIFDPNANFPLNLQRTKLTTETYPFNKELQESVIKDFIAYLLLNVPSQPLYQYSSSSWYEQNNYYGLDNSKVLNNLSPWFSTKTGVGLVNIHNHILQTKAKSAIVLFNYIPNSKSISNKKEEKWLKIFEEASLLFKHYQREDNSILTRSDRMKKAIMFSKILEFASSFGRKDSYRRSLPFIEAGRRILINRKILETIEPLNEISDEVVTSILVIRKNEILDLTEWENKDWIMLKLGDCPKAEFDFVSFAKHNQFSNLDEWPCILTELYFNNEEAEKGSPMLEQIWNDLLQSPVIPYNLKQRKKLFARAYIELEPFIKTHEAMRNKT